MKKRIILWVIFLAISVVYIAFNEYQKSLPVENTPTNKLYIYNDVSSESLVKKAFDKTELSSKYTAEFKDDSDDVDIIITKNTAKLMEDEDKIISTSYTPLIICMKNSKNLQKYQKSGLLISSNDIDNSVQDAITIDFKKLIDAVINGDNWSVFGGEDNDFKIIVPEEDSVEGKIFYNFLLVTINNGNYPSNKEDLDSAKETANEFLKSCEKLPNAINELKKINSINATDIYVLFESDFIKSSIWDQKKLDISVVYPKVTLVRHIYMQAIKENEQFISFFQSLSNDLNYRTSNSYSFAGEKNYNVNDEITFVEVNGLQEQEQEESSIFEDILFVFFVIMMIAIVLFALGTLA